MKNATKFAVATLCAVILIPFAGAQSPEPTPQQMLPADIDIVVDVDLTQPNPFTPWVEEWSSTTEETTPASEDQILFRLLTQQPFTFAMNQVEATEEDPYPMPEMHLFGDLSEQDFEDLIAANLYEDEEPTIVEHNGTQIYELSTDMYLFQFMNMDIITSTLESAQTLIDTYQNSGESLSQTDYWSNSEERLSINGFVSMYIDPTFASQDPESQAIFEEMGLNQSLIDLIIGESIRLAQTEAGYDFEVYIEGDQAKLEELDMEFDKYNFTPELYKYISGNDLILYTEGSGADQWKADLEKSFTPDSEFTTLYDEVMTEIETDIGINFDQDLFPYLNGNNMIVVHNSEQLMPAITGVFKANSSFKGTLDHLNSKVTDANAEDETYQQQLQKIDDDYFVHHMITDPELGEVDLWLGLNEEEELFIISTHHNLASILNVDGGINLNDGFAMNFEGPQNNTASIFYMDFQNLADFIGYGMTEQEASEQELQDFSDWIAPWHNLYMVSYAEGNQTWGNGSLGVDHELLAQIEWDEFLFGSTNVYDDASVEPLQPTDLTVTLLFCDVQKDDWFYSYVTNLSGMNVVQGYSDGCFRPNDPVTRAEFVKMMMAGLDAVGFSYNEIPTSTPAYFSDVNGEWFDYYVNTAASNSFVQGYEDDTFRPNNPITRAEAAQALFGLGALEDPIGANPFTDVQSSDWFNNAVTALYESNIINGKSQGIFDPHANITRAEAAKIIDLYLEHIQEQQVDSQVEEIEEPAM